MSVDRFAKKILEVLGSLSSEALADVFVFSEKAFKEGTVSMSTLALALFSRQSPELMWKGIPKRNVFKELYREISGFEAIDHFRLFAQLFQSLAEQAQVGEVSVLARFLSEDVRRDQLFKFLILIAHKQKLLPDIPGDDEKLIGALEAFAQASRGGALGTQQQAALLRQLQRLCVWLVTIKLGEKCKDKERQPNAAALQDAKWLELAGLQLLIDLLTELKTDLENDAHPLADLLIQLPVSVVLAIVGNIPMNEISADKKQAKIQRLYQQYFFNATDAQLDNAAKKRVVASRILLPKISIC